MLGEFITEDRRTITADSDPITFTYYTYENIQQPNKDALRPDGSHAYENGTLKFPDGVLDAREKDPLHEKNIARTQRWKPTIAKKEAASALVINGSYTTHQGMTYKAKFTIYMGKDPVQDFTVERNNRYNNYVTIHGLDYVRNSDDNTYTFDGRVNVKTDNPVYLAMVNERKIDAHASVLPMDVWLLLREPDPLTGEIKPATHESTVTIEIPEEAQSWISMVMIPRKGMKNGTNGKPGFSAGLFAEPYFYDGLIADANDGTIRKHSIYNDIRDGMQSGRKIVIKSTPGEAGNNSRSRIYFYIDENVPDLNDLSSYSDRKVAVKVTYERRDLSGNLLEAPRVRSFEIEQRKLIHVVGTSGSRHIDAWMEYYEEYMDHHDPLDKHEMPGEYYTGLPWAKEGSELANFATNNNSFKNNLINRSTDTFEIYTTQEAFNMTKAVLSRSGAVSMTSVALFNDIIPTTAFHYCVGKNKRDKNNPGTVPMLNDVSGSTKGWYMPGITELEVALTNNYSSFPEFQTNYYWSASAGKMVNTLASGIQVEVNDRARSTKVKLGGGYEENETKGEYRPIFEGGWVNIHHPEGSALRTKSLRIRAFYKP